MTDKCDRHDWVKGCLGHESGPEKPAPGQLELPMGET